MAGRGKSTAPPDGGGGGNSGAVVAVAMLVAVFLLGALLWSANKESIQRTTYKLARAEAVVGSYIGITSAARKAGQDLHLFLRQTNPYELTPGRVMAMMSASGRLLLPLNTLIFSALAFAMWKRNVRQYRRKLDFEGLLQEMAKTVPSIRPILNLKEELIESDPLVGPWRYPDDYWSLAVRHRLLIDSAGRHLPKTLPKTAAWALDEKRAEQLFIAQLGKPWEGLNRCAGYYRAIIAVLLCFAVTDRDRGYRIIETLATSYRPPDGPGKPITLNLDGVEEAIAKYGNNARVAHCFRDYAFTNCVMSALLRTARRNAGVIATGEWRWLRPTNRSLHYALDQVDRRRAWPEAAGVRAQMLAEEANGRPLLKPLIAMAVISLRQELSDEGLLSPKGPSFLPYQDASGNPDEARAKATAAQSRFEGYARNA